jgi:hypothetical protein
MGFEPMASPLLVLLKVAGNTNRRISHDSYQRGRKVIFPVISVKFKGTSQLFCARMVPAYCTWQLVYRLNTSPAVWLRYRAAYASFLILALRLQSQRNKLGGNGRRHQLVENILSTLQLTASCRCLRSFSFIPVQALIAVQRRYTARFIVRLPEPLGQKLRSLGQPRYRPL